MYKCFTFGHVAQHCQTIKQQIKFKGKKIGFGCIDSAKNEVDSFETTQELIEKGVNIVGVDDILLDPDCGLRRAPMDVAFNKLKLINDIKSKYQ